MILGGEGNEKMNVILTELNGVTLIKPTIFEDQRGFFLESYNKKKFEKIGITTEFVQDNHSYSSKGVIRGLHYQRIHPQEKIVRVVSGSIYDVVVDIRSGSSCYGKSIGLYLTDKDITMIHVPVGFAHGFLALEDATQVVYKTSEHYYPKYDAGILWNDPALGIPWPLEKFGITKPIISMKDGRLPYLKDIDTPFEYKG
jgi:dTDP-4-dehydrorhamnose 3,5-epimerase